MNQTPYQKFVNLLLHRWGNDESIDKMEITVSSFAEMFFREISKNHADFRHVKELLLDKEIIFLKDKRNIELNFIKLRKVESV